MLKRHEGMQVPDHRKRTTHRDRKEWRRRHAELFTMPQGEGGFRKGVQNGPKPTSKRGKRRRKALGKCEYVYRDY